MTKTETAKPISHNPAVAAVGADVVLIMSGGARPAPVVIAAKVQQVTQETLVVWDLAYRIGDGSQIHQAEGYNCSVHAPDCEHVAQAREEFGRVKAEYAARTSRPA